MEAKDKRLLEKLVLRAPVPDDGYALNQLVSKCPPLDRNSVYCNLLQCTHFSATSVAAVVNNRIVGFISAYRPPSDPKTLFVWQVVVDEMVRGHGIAKRMLNWLVNLPSCVGAFKLSTTITLNNGASRALFESFARDCGAHVFKSVLFKRDAHFAGSHDDEYLYCLSPLPNRIEKTNSFRPANVYNGMRLLSSKRQLD